MISVSRLRYWFAAATILVVAVVAGFYIHARYRVFRHIANIPQNISVDIQQSTDTFSLSKSEGGRTLFTIRASKAVQYKQGGRAALHNVNIVVYGHDSNRFDQIYGDEFDYDPQTGDVSAKGVVHIDLQANPVPDAHPELKLPRELKNPIHLSTSGLVFNQKSGMAKTDEQIEFQIPQASGSATGAYYDSKLSTLTLGSNITVQTTGPGATKIVAHHGTITRDPRRAVLDRVEVERSDDTITANKATLFLREDNSLERVLAEGEVRTAAKGQTGLTTEAPRAEFLVNDKNRIQSAMMSGGVTFATTGANLVAGNSGRLVANFGPEGRVQVIHATEGVAFVQRPATTSSAASMTGPSLVRARSSQKSSSPGSRDDMELRAQAMDFFVKGGRVLERAETLGSGQITITPQASPQGTKTGSNGPTVITAGKFTASFNNNRLSALHGGQQAKIVQSTPGQPDRISTSDALEATFDKAGAISGFVQQGNFQYHEGQLGEKVSRSASADKASYSNATQVLTLEGSPRVVDGTMATTAQLVRLNRASGDAEAQGNIKTTYSALSSQPGGALLASGDPVHVTAAKMSFSRASGVARYTGNARLWQGANIIEAPSIDFNRDKRSMDAQGNASKRVAVVLVQADKKGNRTPVNVLASRLSYTDQQRVAHFEGGVVIRSSDGTVTADRLDAYLKAKQDRPKTGTDSSGPSELERLVADGHIVMQQPNRRGTGEKLVYTADDGKFVMTGGPPTIFDAEQGTVTGAALTFYSRDDKVLVEGGGNSRAVTTTRVSK